MLLRSPKPSLLNHSAEEWFESAKLICGEDSNRFAKVGLMTLFALFAILSTNIQAQVRIEAPAQVALGETVGFKFTMGEPGVMYFADLSISGVSPGETFKGQHVALNRPWFFDDQIFDPSNDPAFSGFHGVSDAQGEAVARLHVPNLEQLVGVKFSCAFITLDFSAPFKIGQVSASVSTTVVKRLTIAPKRHRFYIDFDHGSNLASGSSPSESWKHCPGDPEATGLPAAHMTKPGTTFVFKGGTRYRGSIRVNASGVSSSQDICFDGNTEGNFGDGPAIIDGSEIITGFMKCKSLSQGGGSIHWKKLLRAPLPEAIDPLGSVIAHNDSLLQLAQSPNPASAFHFQDLLTYRTAYPAQVTKKSIQDPEYLSSFSPNLWKDGLVALRAVPNLIYYKRIVAFDTALSRLHFEPVQNVYTNEKTHYSILNTIRDLDKPGEYMIDNENGWMYLWPIEDASHEVSYSARKFGIDLYGRDYVSVRGFKIRNHKGGQNEWRSGTAIRSFLPSSNISIVGNVIENNRSYVRYGAIYLWKTKDSVVSGNTIRNNVFNRGIFVSESSRVLIEDNDLSGNGYTGISLFGCSNSVVEDNTVTNHVGVHASGMSIYSGTRDSVVRRNKIVGGRIALSISESKDLLILRNHLSTPKEFRSNTLADYGGSTGLRILNNLIDSGHGSSIYVQVKSLRGLEVKNNVIAGSNLPKRSEISHNIYTALRWNQASRYGWSYGEGEFFHSDMSSLFQYAPSGGLQLSPLSPAVDAGTFLNVHEAFRGVGVDIGPIESR